MSSSQINKKRRLSSESIDECVTQSDDDDIEDCEDSDIDEAENILNDYKSTTKTKRRKRLNKAAETDSQPVDNNAEEQAATYIKGDFHTDTSLCDMHYDNSRNEYDKPYSVILDQSVLSGILDHVYSDHTNEVIGLLGGIYDEAMNVVHVKHYYASIRDVNNMAVDGVSCDGNEIVKASSLFSTKHLNFVGWYHSHPRIPPFPSMKDLTMQKEMQNQAPYAFGIICSAYYNEAEGKYTSDRHTIYFNSFRTRVNQKNELEALRVMSVVNEQPHLSSEIQHQMQGTLRTAYRETKETFECLVKSMKDDELGKAKQLFLTSQYQSFLTSFWKNSIMQNTTVLQHDIHSLKSHNEKLAQLIAEKKNMLKLAAANGTKPHYIGGTSNNIQELEIGKVLNTHHGPTVESVHKRASNVTETTPTSSTCEPDSNTTTDALLLQNVFSDNTYYTTTHGFYLIDGPMSTQNSYHYYEKFNLHSETFKIGDAICFLTQDNVKRYLRLTSIALPVSCTRSSPDEHYRNVWLIGETLAPPSEIGDTEQYDGELVHLVQSSLSPVQLHTIDNNFNKIYIYQYETFIQKKFGEDTIDETKLFGCSRQWIGKKFAPIPPELFS